MKNRIYLFIACLTCWVKVFAQTPEPVELHPFQYKNHFNQLFSGDRRNFQTDSVTQATFALNDLNYTLGAIFPIYIKNYGNGMASGISLRGTGNNHTALNWNGINLNSPTLGGAILNSGIGFLTDQIAVIPGAGSATAGSGAVGGSVELTDQLYVSKIKNNSCTIAAGGGNYNSYQLAGQYKFSATKSAHQFKSVYLTSANNFPYIYNGNVMLNNGADYASFHMKYQGLWVFKNKSSLSASIWYEQNHKGMQQGMGTIWNVQRMNDQYFRSLLHYVRALSRKLAIHSRAALLQDAMKYVSLSENSTNKVWRALLETYIQSGEKVRVNYKIGVVSQQFILSPGSTYISGKQENRTDLYAYSKYKLNGMWSTYLNLRQVLVNGVNQPFCYDAGINFNKEYKLGFARAALRNSSNYRLPTLNERYWWPGGNPALKPELSKQVELNLEGNYKFKKASFSVIQNLFHNRIKNWIQWVPGSSTLWSPINLTEVWITGSESIIEAQLNKGIYRWNARAFFNYNLSNIYRNAGMNEGKQLIYAPFNTAGGNLSLHSPKFMVSLLYQYNGFRYTSTDNQHWLPAFHLCHLSIAKSYKSKLYTYSTFIQVSNLFNVAYQTVENFAMPGRNLMIRLQINYNKIP